MLHALKWPRNGEGNGKMVMITGLGEHGSRKKMEILVNGTKLQLEGRLIG